MSISYHVTVDRRGNQWRAVCPALKDHGATLGGETREEALTHIESAIFMIVSEMKSAGVSPPPDQQVIGGILLTVEIDNVSG